jgi:hypothetical protein
VENKEFNIKLLVPIKNITGALGKLSAMEIFIREAQAWT